MANPHCKIKTSGCEGSTFGLVVASVGGCGSISRVRAAGDQPAVLDGNEEAAASGWRRRSGSGAII
jgi:hypothetical protein